MIVLYWALMQNLSVNPAVLAPPTLIQLFFCLAAPHKQKVGTLSVPDMRQICRTVSPSKQATRSAFPFFPHMSTLFFFNGHKFSHKLT